MAHSTVIWNRSWVRKSIGIILLIVSLYVLTSYAFVFKSNTGIVNTTIAEINSPIAGTVSVHDYETGDWVNKDDTVLTVKNSLQDTTGISSLVTEKTSLSERVSSLKKEKEEMESLRLVLYNRYLAFSVYTKADLERELVDLHSQLKVVERLQKLASNMHKDAENLYKKKIFTRETLYVHAREKEEYLLDILRIQARIKEIGIEKDALDSSIILDNGKSDTTYIQQRIDVLDVEILEIAARINESSVRVKEIAREIEENRLHFYKLSTYQSVSPVNGVVWRKYVHTGKFADANNELMSIANCDSVFVDSVIPNTLAETVLVGDKVRLRLLGDYNEFDGVVEGLYGASSKAQDRHRPAILPEIEQSSVVVRISVDPKIFKDQRNNFCYIGRQVSVKFDRDLTGNIKKLWDMTQSVF